MKRKLLTLDEQLIEEQKTVSRLIEFYKANKDFNIVVYEDWTAKDVLGHITSWHMSFQRNLESAVKNEKAAPFAGSLTDVNEREVLSMKKYSINELIEKIECAQNTIEMNIKGTKVKEIEYKKGSRNYSPIEHLEIVQRHIDSHLRDVENKGVCFWNNNWEKGNYDISKNFGIKNYVKQYLPRKKY